MKTYYASRYQFPTKVTQAGQKGVLEIGHKKAKEHIGSQRGKPLHAETRVDKRGGNWRFREPEPGDKAA